MLSTQALKKRTRRPSRRQPVFAPVVSDVMPARNIRLRFRATNAGTVSITLQRVLGALGAVNTAASTWVALHNSLRVNSVSVYGAGVVGEVIRLAWTSASDIYSSNRVASDICNTISVPAFIRESPPPGEDISGWVTAAATSSNAELCRVTCSAGAVVDLNLSTRMFTGLDNATMSTITTTSGGTVGDMKYISFDGTVLFTVQDLPTVF